MGECSNGGWPAYFRTEGIMTNFIKTIYKTDEDLKKKKKKKS